LQAFLPGLRSKFNDPSRPLSTPERPDSQRTLKQNRLYTSREIRTLDAIHLATALYVEADELVAYDRRLLEAAGGQGMTIASPGRG